MNTIIISVVTLSLLAVVLAGALYVVAQRFHVEDDGRIDDVEALLPGVNCGGCGFAGCRALAEAAVRRPTMEGVYCPVGGGGVMDAVAALLGKAGAAQAPEPMLAVVRCAGDCTVRPRTNRYDGAASCLVMHRLYKGDTDCAYGCAGHGDCVRVCAFDALSINPATSLPDVRNDRCTACGACVRACPKGLIELRRRGPKGRRIFVACINRDRGGTARRACGAACIACIKCQKVCAFEAITIDNNVAYIDFTKCRLCRKCPGECPTGAIREAGFPPAGMKG
ncbi:MAG: RnfABCDGE type electron transport complex subunit B [Prevotellaceae bacterium]|jgi:Na+-translocating ferredoxin:NAD+ oxidoreductase RNF subunit RnfB|nr:RnfABCDGE type electron transport complex subunit B [Prevotellaceae bacterium]